jgi:hypothetical protein
LSASVAAGFSRSRRDAGDVAGNLRRVASGVLNVAGDLAHGGARLLEAAAIAVVTLLISPTVYPMSRMALTAELSTELLAIWARISALHLGDDHRKAAISLPSPLPSLPNLPRYDVQNQ